MLLKKSCFALNINKAASINKIPAKFLKDSADVLAYPPSRIINLPVKLSVFQENVILPN